MKTASFVATAITVALSFAGLGCGAHPDADHQAATTEEELSATTPIPYVLQFVDAYDNTAPTQGGLVALELLRNGRYRAWFDGQSAPERGLYKGPAHPPTTSAAVKLVLVTRGQQWTATITNLSGDMTVVRDGVTMSFKPEDAVGPNEGLCDDSGGAWADDDADPVTGLFCGCPQGQSYIPSAGGCVR